MGLAGYGPVPEPGYYFKIYASVKFKIISRHRNPLGLKDRDDHHLHADAADRLHLMC